MDTARGDRFHYFTSRFSPVGTGTPIGTMAGQGGKFPHIVDYLIRGGPRGDKTPDTGGIYQKGPARGDLKKHRHGGGMISPIVFFIEGRGPLAYFRNQRIDQGGFSHPGLSHQNRGGIGDEGTNLVHPLTGQGGYPQYPVPDTAIIFKPLFRIRIIRGKVVFITDDHPGYPGDLRLEEGTIQKPGTKRGSNRAGKAEHQVHIGRQELGGLTLLVKPGKSVPPFFHPPDEAGPRTSRIRLKIHPIPRGQGVIITLNPLEDLSLDPAGEEFRIRLRSHGPDKKDIAGTPDYQTPHLIHPSGFTTEKILTGGKSAGFTS
jgi:hypothetical protein